MRKENKHNDFIQQFLLFHVNLFCVFMRVPWCMRVNYSACKQATVHPGSIRQNASSCVSNTMALAFLSMGGSESTQISSKHILSCVPKMNDALRGLERRV